MQWNYSVSQLNDTNLKSLLKLGQEAYKENNTKTISKESSHLNFQENLSDDMARMLQHSY